MPPIAARHTLFMVLWCWHSGSGGAAAGVLMNRCPPRSARFSAVAGAALTGSSDLRGRLKVVSGLDHAASAILVHQRLKPSRPRDLETSISAQGMQMVSTASVWRRSILVPRWIREKSSVAIGYSASTYRN